MKTTITPYVRPDGIIVGIKGKAPKKPMEEWNGNGVHNYGGYVFGYGIAMKNYEEALAAFIQSGHAFEDQKAILEIADDFPDSSFECLRFNEGPAYVLKRGLHPPIELDVTEVVQFRVISIIEAKQWIDVPKKVMEHLSNIEFRTVLRIAKEEAKPTEEATETQEVTNDLRHAMQLVQNVVENKNEVVRLKEAWNLISNVVTILDESTIQRKPK